MSIRGLLPAVTLVLLLHSTATPAQTRPRTSLRAVEEEVMCVECGTPLNISSAPVADRERAFIRREVAAGKSKQEVKNELAAEFGSGVLAMPRARGFNWVVYLAPFVLLVVVSSAFALGLRRARKATPVARSTPTAAELRRLDHDLSFYDG